MGHNDFSSIRFDAPFFAQGFILPKINFDRSTFGDAYFASTDFGSTAGFVRTIFRGILDFRSAAFDGTASFFCVTFGGIVNLEPATFNEKVSFAATTFRSNAYFTHVIFGDTVDLVSATFRGSADFVNAEMKGPTEFDEVSLSGPPKCFNAKLHEGTTWHDVHWPETPGPCAVDAWQRLKLVEQAREFIDAYRRLKLEMDRLKNHKDELRFFALEQQCRRVVDCFWKGLPIAIYGALSDYGRSYIRPLLLIAAVLLVGAFLSAYQLVGFWAPMPSRAFFFSFANTFSVLGIRREFVVLSADQSVPHG